jgi:hypothetical protein
LDGIEREADALLGMDGEKVNQSDADSNDLAAEGEVELVYSGLMENERGAQASAAHWEARRLDDDDIEQLGYGADDARTQES